MRRHAAGSRPVCRPRAACTSSARAPSPDGRHGTRHRSRADATAQNTPASSGDVPTRASGREDGARRTGCQRRYHRDAELGGYPLTAPSRTRAGRAPGGANSAAAASRNVSSVAGRPRRRRSASCARHGLAPTPPSASRAPGTPPSRPSHAAPTGTRANAHEARPRTPRGRTLPAPGDAASPQHQSGAPPGRPCSWGSARTEEPCRD